MPPEHAIAVDLARVYKTADRKNYKTTLAWGDEVEVVEVTDRHVEIRLTRYHTLRDGSIFPQQEPGFIVPTRSSGIKPDEVVALRADVPVLKVDFVDVQQGDASVIETPGGQVMLVDGGDNQLFARYLANRYQGTSVDKPLRVDCMLVTHGDADHFAGLPEIQQSETHRRAWKRLFIAPQRVYHNGLVKRPSKVKESEQLGQTITRDGITLITELEENLLAVPDEKMNEPFRDWRDTLQTYQDRYPQHAIAFKRIEKGDDDAFDFLANEGLTVEVLGPIMTEIGGVRGLRFLGKPPAGPHVGHRSLEETAASFSGKSVSHTINGHSIVFRMTFGGFGFLFAGDLNRQAETDLVKAHQLGELSLRADVFKVPHHGSADFLPQFIGAVSPVISVISSGDENERKEYIHPRATLVGALGKHSRLDEPIIFVTEMVAFFKTEGFMRPEFHQMRSGKIVFDADNEPKIDQKAKDRGWFFAFSRAAFGLVRVRTDGERLLVYTNSGQADMKEAYVFRRAMGGDPVPQAVRQA